MPNKIDIVDGAYQLMRISGITVQANPNEIVLAVQVLDDYNAELKPMMDTGYIQPIEYGQSDPNDFSGLTAEMAGPMKKLLAVQLVTFFGKEVPATLYRIAEDGMRSLEQLLVNVGDMQNPATLPIGSGNEYDYRSDKFYREPNNNDDAENYYQNEVFQLPIDWSSWLADVYTLDSVTYEYDSGLIISNESLVDNISVATIGFSAKGQFTLCVVATNSNGDIKNERFVYNSIDCRQPYYP